MATHDYVLANQSGSSFRTDLNNALAAVVSNNSNATEPSTKYAYELWADTNSGYLKIRNAANNAWIQLFKLDGTDLANICRLTGSTNNTICTVTSANNIQGEANLTYDGTQFNAGPALFALGNVSKTQDGLILQRATTTGFCEIIAGRSGGSWSALETYVAGASGVTKRYVNLYSGEHEWFKADGSTGVLKTETNGDVKIHDGDLVIGTSGHGIDFSASEGTGATNSQLDDYEQGTFTPRIACSTNSATVYQDGYGAYTKVGNKVTVSIRMNNVHQASMSGTIQLGNLPYSVIDYGSSYIMSADFATHRVAFNTSQQYAWQAHSSSNSWRGITSNSNGNWDDWTHTDWLNTGIYMNFSGTYFSDD